MITVYSTAKVSVILLGLPLVVYLFLAFEDIWRDDLLLDDSPRPMLSSREDALHSFPHNHRHLFHIFDPQHISLPPRFQVVDLRAAKRPEWAAANVTGGACVRSKTSPPFTVCLYPPEKDVYITKSLLTSGLWEPYITKAFSAALARFPQATVVDVGANVGYYSLLASAAGHRVVAVEPQDENIRRFIAGARSDPWHENMLLLANVLSHKHQNVSLSQNVDNQGGIQVLENCGHLWPGRGHGQCTVVTLTFDDLLYVVATKYAIIKVDIEGYECKALATAAKFFSAIKVPYVFMEWRQMTERRLLPQTACPAEGIDALARFFAQRGYVPHEIRSGIELNPYRASTWRVGDVYWRSQEQEFLVPSL